MDMQQMLANAAQAEEFLKLLANRNRLMILCTLLQKESSVSELNETVPLAQSALSQHLAALRSAQLVGTRRDGKAIFYSVTDERVKALIATLYEQFCQVEAQS